MPKRIAHLTEYHTTVQVLSDMTIVAGVAVPKLMSHRGCAQGNETLATAHDENGEIT
jgi:hypothetical protein